MRKVLLPIMVLVVALALGGCGGAMSTKETASQDAAGEVAYDSVAAVPGKPAAGEPQEESGVARGLVQKIIRTVSMTIVVSDVEKTVSEIETLLKDVNGYVQDANLWQSDNNWRGQLVLRVPTANVDGLIPKLESLGRVERKNISGQDVTEEYYDVEARKNNLKTQEARYLELLDKADTVKEMLEIENELARVRGEIESLEARLKVLDNRVDLATINLELRAPKSLSTGETLREPFGERILTGWQRGVNGMINFVQDMVVLLVVLLPYAPLIALVGYVAYRVRKIKSKVKSQKSQVE